MSKETVVKDALSEAMDTLNKRYGKGAVLTGDETVITERIGTGSLGLDIITGGGYGVGRIVELYGVESAGKAQPLYSKILTPTGWIKMKDVEIGTIVSTPNGKESTIIGIFPQGDQDVYRVTLDDKSYTDCTLDHLWYVNVRESKIGDVLSTKQLLELGLKSGIKKPKRKFKIPNVAPIEFDNCGRELPIDPYLLGILLGDGGLTSGVKFTTADEFILEKVKSIVKDSYHGDAVVSGPFGGITYNIVKAKKGHGHTKVYEDLGILGLIGKLSYDKHIPEEYLRASYQDRVALYQGMMDSDGSVDQGTLSYTTTSSKMSVDFQDLCRGLGIRCNTHNRTTQYTSKTGNKVDGRESYRSSMLMCHSEFEAFTLPRQVEKSPKTVSGHNFRFIESIELVGREECQCIMIGDQDKLYITDNYIVTHNTTLCIHAMVEAQKKFPHKKVAVIDTEHSFDKTYAEALGLKMDEVIISQPSCGEEALEIAELLINTGKLSICMIDSVAALIPQKEIDGEMGDSNMGLHARLMSQACRKLTGPVSKTGTVLFFTNQMRMKIGLVFGDPRTTTGGEALKFYASMRIELSKKQGEKDGDEVLTSHVTCKTVKNKLAPPFRKCEFEIRFGEGIDRLGEILDLAVASGIVKKTGSWYAYGETKLGQGPMGAKETLKAKPEIAQEIEDNVMEAYNF